MLIVWPAPGLFALSTVAVDSSSVAPATAVLQGAEERASSPVPIAAILQNPSAHEQQPLMVEGVIVRITRSGGTGGVEPPAALLLQDAAGDTISVFTAAEAPRLGARVQVSGRVALDAGGILRIHADARGLVVQPEPGRQAAPPSSDSFSPGMPSGAEWPSRLRGVLGVGAAMLLLGAVIVFRRRWSPRDDGRIPLIVDLDALAAPAAVAPQDALPAPAEPLPPLEQITAPPTPAVPGPTAGGVAAAVMALEPPLQQPAPLAPPPAASIPRAAPVLPEEPEHGALLPELEIRQPEPEILPPSLRQVQSQAGDRENQQPASVIPQPATGLERIPPPAPPVEAPVLRHDSTGSPPGLMDARPSILHPSRSDATSPDEKAHSGGTIHGNGGNGALELGTEAPLQLLPGMLEVIEGADAPPQIRFFRSAALEVPEVTLGRSHGPPYRHVHLWAPSVSRIHARLRFEGGRWRIANLSQVNPVRVNGQALEGSDEGCTLADGDRIQLGEVVLRYRENVA